MNRAAYFDCYSGASGDMILGALVDAGLPVDELRSELHRLPVDGYELTAEKVTRHGLAGTHVRVLLGRDPSDHRSLGDIERIIGASSLDSAIKERATGVFRRLGQAEAHVHGIPIDQVHFHEVGAVDAIVDVVGSVIGLDRLGIERAYASSVPLGRGMVETAHGRLPLPAPATLELLAQAHAPTRPADIDQELLTPTGAAILTTVAEFRQPAMTIERVALGFGTRELPWANALRLWIGELAESGLETGEITLLETNLDDCTPEQAGYAMERLLAEGALDVFFTPIQMKKNRPAVLLSVISAPALADSLARTMLRETTSLGVRFRSMQRLMAPRRAAMLETSFGPLQVKMKILDGREIVCPEYEACARAAREHHVPLSDVYAAVIAAGRDFGA